MSNKKDYATKDDVVNLFQEMVGNKLITISFLAGDESVEQEAQFALKVMDIVFAISDLDQFLRDEIKYNDDLSEDTHDAYDEVRSKIRDLLDERGVNLGEYL